MSTPCSICKEAVTKKRAPGVQCNGRCKQFFHYDCAKIGDDDIEIIEKKSFDYKCKTCRNGRQSLVFARKDSVSSELTIEKKNDEKNDEKITLKEIKESQIELKESVLRLEEIMNNIDKKFDQKLKSINDFIKDMAKKTDDVNLNCNLEKKIDENLQSVKDAFISVSNESHAKIMKEMNEVVNKVGETSEKIVTEESKQQKKTYAEKLKSKSESVLIITPKNPDQSSSTTQLFVRNAIDPGIIPIRNMRQKLNGKVVVECTSKKDEEEVRIQTETALGEEYEVKIPKQLNPRIKIVGLTENLSKEDVLNYMKKQNEFMAQNSSLEIIQVKENRQGTGYIVIAEVDGNCYNICMQNKRINIKWDRCRVYDYINIRRCFNCAGYNHLASFCKNRKACTKCAEEHTLTECQNEDVKCRNCIIANERVNLGLDIYHPSWSQDCETYKRKVNAKMKMLDYNE